jgi:hypothetical protein
MNTSCQHAVYFIAEIVLKCKVVACFKLHRDLTVTCSEIGNKNIPLSVRLRKNLPFQSTLIYRKVLPIILGGFM